MKPPSFPAGGHSTAAGTHPSLPCLDLLPTPANALLQTFRSKEISKSNVVDDMVQSNSILYG